MVAIDIASTLLIVGIIVLCATTAVTALSLPGIDWRFRRRPTADHSISRYTIEQPLLSRRVVTGRPATLPHGSSRDFLGPIELPPAPPRQITRTPDGPQSDVDDAEALLARLAEQDPERLAELMMYWMKSDTGSNRPERT